MVGCGKPRPAAISGGSSAGGLGTTAALRYIAWVSVLKALLGLACAGLVAACSSGESAHPADIKKVFTVESTFGPEFRVKGKGPSGIDPQLEGSQGLPPNVTFEPADCGKYTTGQRLPLGTQGKMAAVFADGKGNRFVTVAFQTADELPFEAIPDQCKHVTFSGPNLNGVVDAVDAPQIEGAHTLGTYRQVEAKVGEKEQSQEVYHFAAYLGRSLVVVTAAPLAAPNQPPSPIDVDRARRLLTDAVSAIRG